jgi:hypothetical protein
VVFKLSGRIETENIAEVKALLSGETSRRHVLLELSDLTLVDREVVSFLRDSEANGIELKNCPAYVREWMKQEKKLKLAHSKEVPHGADRFLAGCSCNDDWHGRLDGPCIWAGR